MGGGGGGQAGDELCNRRKTGSLCKPGRACARQHSRLESVLDAVVAGCLGETCRAERGGGDKEGAVHTTRRPPGMRLRAGTCCCPYCVSARCWSLGIDAENTNPQKSKAAREARLDGAGRTGGRGGRGWEGYAPRLGAPVRVAGGAAASHTTTSTAIAMHAMMEPGQRRAPARMLGCKGLEVRRGWGKPVGFLQSTFRNGRAIGPAG